ncbi:hypothetical protein ACHAWF_013623 [Thalassiosira exigua]
MRFTYFWWTQQFNDGVQRATYGHLGRKENGFAAQWADQEYLVPAINNNSATSCVKRFSLRFLHGSINEFLYKTMNWGEARMAYPSTDHEIKSDNIAKYVGMGGEGRGENYLLSSDERTNGINWTGRVKPSDYALWATQYQKPVKGNSTQFNLLIYQWQQDEPKNSPDIVIITEGWLGIPRPEDLDIVKSALQNNPETLFIWSPICHRKHESPVQYLRRQWHLQLILSQLANY